MGHPSAVLTYIPFHLSFSQSYLEKSRLEMVLDACFRGTSTRITNNDHDERAAVPDALLTASKPELLDKNGDQTLRSLLYDFFAFGRSLEDARAKFAGHVDLTPTQYLILIAIKNSTLDEPMGINQLAARLHLSGAFITNEVNKLVSDGLIEKSTHPSDGRRVQLTVTTQGVSQLTRLASFQRPINDALFGMLTRDEFRLLSQLLARLAANGARAVKLAEHIEATMELELQQAATSATKAPGQRQRQSGGRRVDR
jgi:MarR family transcriptional regulator, organic hydroperoxide resistance regulator